MSSVRPYRYINILRSKRGMHDMGQDFMTTTDTQRGDEMIAAAVDLDIALDAYTTPARDETAVG
jgi:hypothetical protein